MAVQPVPDAYRAATPYLIIEGAAAALDFYKQAFGAVELMRIPGPEGRIGHAEIKIGDAPIMLADECPEMGFRSPKALGGTPVSLVVYVPDVDAVFAKAVAAGGTALRPVQNQFYGDRSGVLVDPFGHCWNISTHIEDVPPEELAKRASQAMPGKGDGCA